MTPAAAPARQASAHATLFERVLFFVLLAVLCARPLISESFEALQLPFLRGLGSGSGAATTAGLDAVALVVAAAALVRAWGRGQRPPWFVVGAGLLAAAVVFSTLAAGDKRLALNAGANLLTAVLCGAALLSLLRAAWMPRLLLAAMLATGCTTATKCLTQKLYEFHDTRAYWQENKARLIPPQMAPDDPAIINFERRMKAGETFAFQPHPNTTGSLLTMWLLVVGGVLAGWLRAGDTGAGGDRTAAVVLCAALAVLLAAGLWFTGSLGAVAALGAGGLGLLALARWRNACAARPRLTTAALLLGYAALLAAIFGYGLSRGTLPHPSLAFRWYYWTTAAHAYRDAPLTGLGRANFADAYLRYKPVESTEDVRDPHQLWLSLLVELGPLGLIAGVVLLASCFSGAWRRLGDSCLGLPATQPSASLSTAQPTPITAAIAAAAGVLLLHAVLSGELAAPATALLWLVQVAAVWVLALFMCVRLLNSLALVAAAWPWVVTGVVAGLGAALFHGLIDFALLTPAGLSVFVALAAVALAPGPAAASQPHTLPTTGSPRMLLRTMPPTATVARRGRGRAVVGLAALLLAAGQLAVVTIPTMRAELQLALLRRACLDSASAETDRTAVELGRAALAADPLSAGTAREVTRCVLGLALAQPPASDERIELLRHAEVFARRTLTRNPRSANAHARLAAIYQELEDALLHAARPDDADAAARQALQHWRAAVALNPADARQRIAAGRAWYRWWEQTDDEEAGREAAAHLAAALRIDRTRRPEEVVRLRPAELEAVHLRLRQLERAGFGVSP